ncbi:MAG: hypothetical protein ACR2RF_29475 [Geminicoccaceae bacterium]
MMDASDIVEATAGEILALVEAQLAGADIALRMMRGAPSSPAAPSQNSETVPVAAEAAAMRQFQAAANVASETATRIGQSNKQGVRSLLTNGVNEINTLFAAKAEANLAAGMLAAAGNADHATTLTDIETRFQDSATALRGSLDALEAVDDFPNVAATISDLLVRAKAIPAYSLCAERNFRFPRTLSASSAAKMNSPASFKNLPKIWLPTRNSTWRVKRLRFVFIWPGAAVCCSFSPR